MATDNYLFIGVVQVSIKLGVKDEQIKHLSQNKIVMHLREPKMTSEINSKIAQYLESKYSQPATLIYGQHSTTKLFRLE